MEECPMKIGTNLSHEHFLNKSSIRLVILCNVMCLGWEPGCVNPQSAWTAVPPYLE